MPLRNLQNWLDSLAGLAVAACLGRLMWVAERASRSHRPIWTWSLFYELPIAFGMAFIAEGIADYLDLRRVTALGLVSVFSYLGPRGVTKLIERVISSGKKDG